MKITIRQHATAAIYKALDGHVGLSRKEVRRLLRPEREKFMQRHWLHGSYAARIWQEEVRFALGERTRKRGSARRLVSASGIIPAAREWAARHGMIAPRAVLDVDLPLKAEANSAADLQPFQFQLKP